MQLSKLESQAFDALKGNNLQVFNSADLSRIMGEKEGIHNLTRALKAKGAIVSPKRDVFYLKGTSEFLVGSHLGWPAYVSFRSALSWHGFTDQMPNTIYYASTRYHKPVGNFRFAALSNGRFFGYEDAGGFAVADKEKAIVDSLLLPRYSGGMKQVAEAFSQGISKLDKKKLADYAIRMESKAVVRRLGFLLDENGTRAPRVLRESAGSGFCLLDPAAGKKNKFNKDWLLDINW
jgi:predicted transcriptional regulator of viral defense system